jgi:hypothetical protein
MATMVRMPIIDSITILSKLKSGIPKPITSDQLNHIVAAKSKVPIQLYKWKIPLKYA